MPAPPRRRRGRRQRNGSLRLVDEQRVHAPAIGRVEARALATRRLGGRRGWGRRPARAAAGRLWGPRRRSASRGPRGGSEASGRKGGWRGAWGGGVWVSAIGKTRGLKSSLMS